MGLFGPRFMFDGGTTDWIVDPYARNIDRATAEPYLDKNLRKVLKTALAEMKHLADEVQRLRSIKSDRMA